MIRRRPPRERRQKAAGRSRSRGAKTAQHACKSARITRAHTCTNQLHFGSSKSQLATQSAMIGPKMESHVTSHVVFSSPPSSSSNTGPAHTRIFINQAGPIWALHCAVAPSQYAAMRASPTPTLRAPSADSWGMALACFKFHSVTIPSLQFISTALACTACSRLFLLAPPHSVDRTGLKPSAASPPLSCLHNVQIKNVLSIVQI